MRHSEQLPLTVPWIGHGHAAELTAISALLDGEPRIAALVQQDLVRGCRKNARTGRPGLTGDQVLRMALARQMNGWTYAELAFHMADSASYRTFCRVGGLEASPSKSALGANLRALCPATLEAISTMVVTSAAAKRIESGQTVRIDSTVVEAAIHAPTDSSLLYDGIRVLLRLLRRGRARGGLHRVPRPRQTRQATAPRDPAHCAPRDRQAPRGLSGSPRARPGDDGLCHLCPGPARDADHGRDPFAAAATGSLSRLPRAGDGANPRRVLHGEAVPAAEKLVSLFEPHADVIVKDRRETLYGHKIFLTGDASGLILDCAIVKGNPADSTWALPMLTRHRQRYARPPRQATLDGGFASKDNLRQAKALGVQDVCFTKRRGLAVLDMVRSTWVYRKLKRFRAEIESVISLLKRAFGLDRCVWKGATGFVAYVRLGVLTANLLTLARHQLA